MSNNANDALATQVAALSWVEDISQIADAEAAGSTQVVDIEVDCRAIKWFDPEYKTGYADTLHARRVFAML